MSRLMMGRWVKQPVDDHLEGKNRIKHGFELTLFDTWFILPTLDI